MGWSRGRGEWRGVRRGGSGGRGGWDGVGGGGSGGRDVTIKPG